MTPSKILVETAAPVTTIVINRPQAKNALDNEAARALAEALKAFEADPQARVAVLTGAGGAFCAGADLKELGSGTDYFPWAGSDDGPLRAPLGKPVIAAIEGHACAGGLGVALFCDIRIVDETATFGVFSRRWGVPMSDGTPQRRENTPKVAVSSTMRMSQNSATPSPPAQAWPSMAAITGFDSGARKGPSSLPAHGK